MKRSVVNEISEIRSRLDSDSRYNFIDQLNNIETALYENLKYEGEFNHELLKYIPIATVACFEAFFRSIYKQLIDFGKPFNDNAVKFNQSRNIKFDFEIVSAIQTKTLTLGEFISHILPCNNFEDINSNLSILIDKDFLAEIKKFEKKYLSQTVPGNSQIFVGESVQIISDIRRIFELRHIFCHEFGTNIRIDIDEITRCLKFSKVLLTQVDDFISELLYPNAPQTQQAMNKSAYESFESNNNKLNVLIANIKVALKEEDSYIEFQLFDESIASWDKYRDIRGKLEASYFSTEKGSMYRCLFYRSMEGTTKEMIESLEKEYAYNLRKFIKK